MNLRRRRTPPIRVASFLLPSLLRCTTSFTFTCAFVTPLPRPRHAPQSLHYRTTKEETSIPPFPPKDTPITPITTVAPPLETDPHGMPWHTSIAPYTYPPRDGDGDGDRHDETLLFMPYWEHTVSVLQNSDKLTNVRPLERRAEYEYASTLSSFLPSPPTTSSSTTSSTVQKKKSRIVSRSYTSDEYRKIRLTYYDAGDAVQVFNTLWYPHPRLGNLPLLGVDLLAFGRRSYLVVVDFQPLPPVPPVTEGEDAATVSVAERAAVEEEWERRRKDGAERSAALYETLPDLLKQKMSDRFFDEKEFFSEGVLFGRFDHGDEGIVRPAAASSDRREGTDRGVLFDRFRSYLDAHVEMVGTAKEEEGATGCRCGATERAAWEGQRRYDAYNAERDPAHAMFQRVFGKEWADGYVYDYLFDLSSGGGGDGGGGSGSGSGGRKP